MDYSRGKYKRIYACWSNMKQRCFNPKNTYYHIYGKRGIKICDDWLKFTSFLKWSLDNGYKENLTIDRVDVDMGYSPSNCRWVTQKENQNNKRNNVRLTYKGKTQTRTQWAEEIGISGFTLRTRLGRLKWSVEKAIETPKLNSI